MRYKVISILIVLSFVIISVSLFSCGNLREQYTPSLVFEENNGIYTVTGISANDSDIIIPSTFKGKMVKIGKEAFKDCQQLEKVEINCWIISDSAFENCTNLQSITIGKDVSHIGRSAFANTEKLTEIAYFAENIEDILGGTFLNAGSKGDGIKLTIGKNVKTFPGWFFSACEDVYVKNVLWEDNSQCSYIGPDAFFQCDDLTSIVIPKDVTYIGIACFAGCENLKTISFENREDDWKIYEYTREHEEMGEYKYIVNSDTVKNETEIAKKLVFEYGGYDWRR